MSEQDLYRDTLVRYLGYSNEVGEAFRHYIGHRNVMITYGIATAYCLADTIDKTSKSYKINQFSTKRTERAIYTAFDTITWQMLASVLIPGFTINRSCYVTGRVLKKMTNLPKKMRGFIMTATGLCLIPLIIHPIDHFVDTLLDKSLRKIAP